MPLPSKEAAIALLHQNVNDSYQRPHAQMVATAMEGYAQHFGEDPLLWFDTGLLHEPFSTVLSTDGGNVWQQIYQDSEDAKNSKAALGKYYGILDAGTLLRAQRDPAGIAMSTDAGKTWTEVAKYQVLGRRPVHYGKKVF